MYSFLYQAVLPFLIVFPALALLASAYTRKRKIDLAKAIDPVMLSQRLGCKVQQVQMPSWGYDSEPMGQSMLVLERPHGLGVLVLAPGVDAVLDAPKTESWMIQRHQEPLQVVNGIEEVKHWQAMCQTQTRSPMFLVGVFDHTVQWKTKPAPRWIKVSDIVKLIPLMDAHLLERYEGLPVAHTMPLAPTPNFKASYGKVILEVLAAGVWTWVALAWILAGGEWARVLAQGVGL